LSLPGALRGAADEVVGNFDEQVDPTTKALPAESTVTAFTLENKFPPIRVEYTR
jgi:hypothetical protein